MTNNNLVPPVEINGRMCYIVTNPTMERYDEMCRQVMKIYDDDFKRRVDEIIKRNKKEK